MGDISILLGLLGIIVSFLGLLVAWIQTKRLRALKREENADIWASIRQIRNMFGHLENSKLISENKYIARAYESATSLFRMQLKRATLHEKTFNMETIRKWESVGKLSSEWQINQAKNFLETENIKLLIEPETGKDSE